jgi:hypothetical protein
MEQDPQVREAISVVAKGLGTDMAYFAPPQERHFDPLSVGVALGGILIASFLKGFSAQATQDAEDAGRSTAKWLRDRIGALFARTPEEIEALTAEESAEQVVEAASEARATLANADPAPTSAYLEAARAAIEAELLDYGMPKARAHRLSQSVRAEALTLLDWNDSTA